MSSVTTVAHAVNNVRAQFVSIHDEIYAPSLWRTLRRAIPVPGFFEAIPYDRHAARLGALIQTLDRVHADATAMRASTQRPAIRNFFVELDAYVGALLETMGHLRAICLALHSKAEGASSPSFEEYGAAMATYEASRARCTRLGAPLQAAFVNAASEA